MAETRDLPVRAPVIAMAATAVTVVLGALVVWRLLHGVWAEADRPPPPLAADTATVSTSPPLQRDPVRERQAHATRMAERIDGVGWVNREAGVVHMPVQQAMRLLLERGLPAQDREEPPP